MNIGDTLMVYVRHEHFQRADDYLLHDPLSYCLEELWPDKTVIVGSNQVEIWDRDNIYSVHERFKLLTLYPPHKIDSMIIEARKGEWRVQLKLEMEKTHHFTLPESGVRDTPIEVKDHKDQPPNDADGSKDVDEPL